MRKKSHLSLAGYIVDIVDADMIDHPLAFRFGSLEPDLVPSFITTKHRIDLTFHKLEKKINKVIDEYDKNKGMTIGLSKDLGVITHYIADYFTFPHNIEYPGTMTEHIHYEAQLKVDFREFVRKMKETHAHFQEVNMRSADEICAFIKKCHTEYLHAVKSVENDCRYILQICAQVVRIYPASAAAEQHASGMLYVKIWLKNHLKETVKKEFTHFSQPLFYIVESCDGH